MLIFDRPPSLLLRNEQSFTCCQPLRRVTLIYLDGCEVSDSPRMGITTQRQSGISPTTGRLVVDMTNFNIDLLHLYRHAPDIN